MSTKRSEYNLTIIPLTNSLQGHVQSIDSFDPLLSFQWENHRPKYSAHKKSVTTRTVTGSCKADRSLFPVVDKSVGYTSPRLVKQLSKSLSFTNDVVNERSPHSVSYNKSHLDKIYSNVTVKDHRKKVCRQRKQNHFTTTHDHHEKSKATKEHDNFILDVSSSIDKLKYVAQKNSYPILDVNPAFKESNGEIYVPVKQPTWDEHVLCLLSRNTANMIVEDLTPNHQQQDQLRTFLHDFEVKQRYGREIVTGSIEHVDCSTAEDMDNTPHKYFTKFKTQGKIKTKNILQETYPCSPSLWSKEKDIERKCSANRHRLIKGIKKWTDFPVVTDDDKIDIKLSNTRVGKKDTEESLVDLKESKNDRDDKNLIKAVDEWRSKWLLEKKSYTVEELQMAMRNLNDHVRLAAVTAAGAVILGLQDESGEDEAPILSECEILDEVEMRLDDPCLYVSIAAAVTLYSVNRANVKATEVLMNAVKDGGSSERWVAVQCLAECEHYDDCIIKELLSRINHNDVFKSKKAEKLFRHLSCFTDSIQYMLAEQLNSTSWNDRMVACKVFPLLNGTLSRDIANKLSHLMWNDWNKDVKAAAARALGRTGNGKLVHDVLCKYLQSGNHLKVMDALRRIAYLGIVTSNLFSPILVCLQSQNDAVCLETIKTIGAIKLNDEKINQSLIQLVSSDRNWKIKAYAINALGCIGEKTTSVRDCLLWALHYGEKSVLRSEACAALAKLGINDDEIVKVLQDMIVVENDVKLKRQVAAVLCSVGLEPTGDLAMMSAIRKNVRRLCRKDNVIANILIKSKEDIQKYLEEVERNQDGRSSSVVSTVSGRDVRSSSVVSDVSGRDVRSSSVVSDVSGRDVRSSSVVSAGTERSFHPALEAFRIRNNTKDVIELPYMKPSYIPYCSESSESFFDQS